MVVMDKHIETNYVLQLGPSLPNFKQVKPRQWAFSHSCEQPRPGRRAKTRAYIYEYKPHEPYNVKCFHCGWSVRFTTLLKETNPTLFSEYRLHEYREHKEETPSLTKPEVMAAALEATFKDRPEYFSLQDANLDGLKSVKTLTDTHPIRRWLERRKIPSGAYKNIYYVPKFYTWARRYKPDFKLDNEEPRLVLPYFNTHGKVLGFTCRTFSPKVEPRYIHLRIDKSCDFVYGTERIDPSKKIYVCEGQIDSLFVENCVAIGNANYDTDFLHSIKTNCAIIPDSDWKRNKQVAKQLKKAIDNGFEVCLLPETLPGKDINDFIKNGLTPEELKTIIDKYTFKGLAAKLEFTVNRKFEGKV